MDGASADDVMARLLVAVQQDPDSRSPASTRFTALTAIYDTMQYIQKPQIQTLCLGQAAPRRHRLALAAGSPGKRLGAAARVLIHQPAMEGMQGRTDARSRR